jgi:hypothetical protein
MGPRNFYFLKASSYVSSSKKSFIIKLLSFDDTNIRIFYPLKAHVFKTWPLANSQQFKVQINLSSTFVT